MALTALHGWGPRWWGLFGAPATTAGNPAGAALPGSGIPDPEDGYAGVPGEGAEPGPPDALAEARREQRALASRAQHLPARPQRRRGPAPRVVPAGLDPDPAWTATSGLDENARPMHLLVLGTDQEGFRSDVIFLVRLDPGRKRAAVLNLPRDTVSPIAGGGERFPRWDKLGHASAWTDAGYSGTERARVSVEQLLGVRVHRVIRVQMSAFVDLVDALGGVEVEVPFRMEYSDPWQGLEIQLEPGLQRLTGEQALHLARWRQDNAGNGYGDLGRIKTQRQILNALLAEARRQVGTVVLEAPGLARKVRSDLRLPAEATALALFATGLDSSRIEWFTLPVEAGKPGTPEFGYLFMDEARLADTLANWRGSSLRG